MADFPI